MRSNYTAMLIVASALLLLASGVAGQDPTTYLTAYPAKTTTTQAWQIAQCVYTVKYTIQGRPGLSDFGFGLGTSTRYVSVTGCTAQWYSTGGGGNQCSATYGNWANTTGLIKMNNDGCGQNATFWITASNSMLVRGGTVSWKGATSCWTCNDVPYLPGLGATLALALRIADPLGHALAFALKHPFAVAFALRRAFAFAFSLAFALALGRAFAFAFAFALALALALGRAFSLALGRSALALGRAVAVALGRAIALALGRALAQCTAFSLALARIAGHPGLPVGFASVPPGGDSSNTAAIAGGVGGGLAGLAGLAALGGLVAGGGYLLYRWVNRTKLPAEPASALDAPESSAVGDNALFQERNVMQPNALFADGV